MQLDANRPIHPKTESATAAWHYKLYCNTHCNDAWLEIHLRICLLNKGIRHPLYSAPLFFSGIVHWS